jgi:hypothetical protein
MLNRYSLSGLLKCWLVILVAILTVPCHGLSAIKMTGTPRRKLSCVLTDTGTPCMLDTDPGLVHKYYCTGGPFEQSGACGENCGSVCHGACPYSCEDVCCSSRYGPTCSSVCPGVITTVNTECGWHSRTVCSGHGSCNGAGTRGGNGTCTCDTGYAPPDCSTTAPTAAPSMAPTAAPTSPPTNDKGWPVSPAMQVPSSTWSRTSVIDWEQLAHFVLTDVNSSDVDIVLSPAFVMGSKHDTSSGYYNCAFPTFIDVSSKQLSIRGDGIGPKPVLDAGSTHLSSSPQKCGSLFRGTGSLTDLKLSHLHLKNAFRHGYYSGGGGGAVAVFTGARLELHNCTVSDTRWTSGDGGYLVGGGVFAGEHTTVVITDSVFEDVWACKGGAVYAASGAVVTIRRSVIRRAIAGEWALSVASV